jgi:hypothetical protein
MDGMELNLKGVASAFVKRELGRLETELKSLHGQLVHAMVGISKDTVHGITYTQILLDAMTWASEGFFCSPVATLYFSVACCCDQNVNKSLSIVTFHMKYDAHSQSQQKNFYCFFSHSLSIMNFDYRSTMIRDTILV